MILTTWSNYVWSRVSMIRIYLESLSSFLSLNSLILAAKASMSSISERPDMVAILRRVL